VWSWYRTLPGKLAKGGSLPKVTAAEEELQGTTGSVAGDLGGFGGIHCNTAIRPDFNVVSRAFFI
jgi:hypothetical protein